MQRIESLTLKRFRGIREGEINGLADVNVLIGRNNSGKSTIAEAIGLAASAVGEGSQYGRTRSGAWQRARGEPIAGSLKVTPEMYFARDASQPFEITALGSGETMRFHSQNLHGLSWSAGKTLSPFLERSATFHRFDLDNDEIEKRHWVDLFATRRDKAVIASINDIYGTGIEQVQLPPSGRMLLVFEKHGVFLDLQGDGVRVALRCLLMLSTLQNTVLAIEEPECHQHPASLKRFARAVCKQAHAQEVQLLVTTHSVECINAFLDGAAEAKSEGAVFNLRLQDGVLDARRLTSETAAGLEKSGLDLRELDLYA